MEQGQDKVKYPPLAACPNTVVGVTSQESGPCIVIYPPLYKSHQHP